MSESFVDLSYRGLALGRRIKLTQVRPASGYLEMPTPMPVGTTIAIATDDGVQLEALVTEIHEQVGGAERAPGMLVQPRLDDATAGAWWHARANASATDEAGDTRVMAAAVPDASISSDALVTDIPNDMARDTNPNLPIIQDSNLPAVQDDGKRTMMMDAVDLAALGLASQSQQMPAVTPEDYADDDAAGGAPAPTPTDAGGKTKKKRKRR